MERTTSGVRKASREETAGKFKFEGLLGQKPSYGDLAISLSDIRFSRTSRNLRLAVFSTARMLQRANFDSQFVCLGAHVRTES